MAKLNLPAVIRVRISSENAEGIGLSPVVSQDMPAPELIAQILGVTGKDVQRVREILWRGSLVAGASRFRWACLECDEDDVAQLLAGFPDSDPSRPFEPRACYLAAFRAGSRSIVIERAAGEKRRLFRRKNFWDEMMRIVEPAYSEYSYRERADLYRWKITSQTALGEVAKLLAWSSYEAQLRSGQYETADLYCRR